MPKLSEFLQKQQATVHSVENAKKQEMWLAAVDTLLKQLRTWLADVEAQVASSGGESDFDHGGNYGSLYRTSPYSNRT
jgi:hypothetical protein